MRKSLLLLAALVAAPAVSAQTALSAGTPLASPVYTASESGSTVITQSTSMTIETGGVACALQQPNPGYTTDNSYLRVFDLSTYSLTGPVAVNSVDVGAFFGTGASASDLNIGTTVILYRMAPGTPYTTSFPRASLTEVARATLTVDTGGSPGVFGVAFPTNPTFQNTDLMVVEWSVPDGTDAELNGEFNIRYGSNDDGQSGKTYLSTTTGCNGIEPTDVAALGATFATLHWVLAVNVDAGGVANEGTAQGRRITLGSAVPNPALGSTVIPFEVREASNVRLSVYDALGREVAVLAEGAFAAGRHSATFTANGLPAGAYVYRLVTNDEVLTNRLTVAR